MLAKIYASSDYMVGFVNCHDYQSEQICTRLNVIQIPTLKVLDDQYQYDYPEVFKITAEKLDLYMRQSTYLS